MKNLLITLGATLAAGAATAGAVVYEAPAIVTVDTPSMGGSGTWLIPLAIIAILALTLTNDRPR